MSKNHVNIFYTNMTLVTLPLDLVNLISIRVLSSLRPIRTLHIKSHKSGKHIFFYKSDLCDLDLWPKEHIINRGQALTKTNKHVKYKTYVISSQDNEGKPLLYKSDPSDLDYWPNSPNVNIGYVSIKPNQHVKYESYVINSSQDNEPKPCVVFFTSDPCDLDL